MGVGAGLYMCDVVKKVHVRYLISWWVLVNIRKDKIWSSTEWTPLDNCHKLSAVGYVHPQHEPQVYTTDAGRNFTLSATRPSSIRNLETMASDCMSVFRREGTTAVSTLFNPLNIFVQHHENAFTETVHAHAPYHVIYSWGQIFDHIFEIADPDLPIH